MSRPTNTGDSAGQPWEGRSFQPNSRAQDDGSAPPELVAAIEQFHAGTADEGAVVDVVRGARFLIPLIAHAGEHGVTDEGLAVDKTQELSIITVGGPDGRNVLPVFSSVAAMSSWNAAARPVPAEGVRVALAAAEEGTDVVVIDPTSETEFAIRRPALWAIAQSEQWRPSHSDPEVFEAFERSIGTELAVQGVALAPGDPEGRLLGPETVVRLSLASGLTRQELDAVLARLAARWAADEIIASRVDSLKVALVAA
ncbi:SseB protein N-terminal domain-containing protein [Paramicrobacterium humi]|uniref:SseB protein N-terminal domain-containing protein n=1 Tax=Paramicrobacterium humi TaxID=640635 RepID=A0A1H4PTU8_9MICO|nr:SseB family protein [Microbacterium humi]SEC10806.1 SseB protein N-terminal domain-containing protein [Microbacterium humi]